MCVRHDAKGVVGLGVETKQDDRASFFVVVVVCFICVICER